MGSESMSNEIAEQKASTGILKGGDLKAWATAGVEHIKCAPHVILVRPNHPPTEAAYMHNGIERKYAPSKLVVVCKVGSKVDPELGLQEGTILSCSGGAQIVTVMIDGLPELVLAINPNQVCLIFDETQEFDLSNGPRRPAIPTSRGQIPTKPDGLIH